MVTLTGSGFGIQSSVYFDGERVNARGSGSPLVFTVPYDAAVGPHDVYVQTGSQDSPAVSFQVTSTAAAPDPVIEDYGIGYVSLGPSATEDSMILVLYGSGFDTNCRVVFNNNELNKSYTPGIPPGSLAGVLAAGATLPGFPEQRRDRALIGVLTEDDGNLPALGSNHTARVRNVVTGETSDLIAVDIPARRVLVEFDAIDTVDWPPVAIWRNNTINTLRRTYTRGGLLLDTRYDEEVTDPLAGVDFTMADMVDFFDDNSSLEDDTLGDDEWYFHVALLTTMDTWHPNFIVYGIMYDVDNRQGAAVFADAIPTDEEYLRTLAHEMGHGFNLTHCDGDADPQRDNNGNLVRDANGFIQWNTLGTSIMNQSSALANNWDYFFSVDSWVHLTMHPLNEVQPGSGNMSFNDPNRTFGECDY
jgi:hypothetical protein